VFASRSIGSHGCREMGGLAHSLPMLLKSAGGACARRTLGTARWPPVPAKPRSLMLALTRIAQCDRVPGGPLLKRLGVRQQDRVPRVALSLRTGWSTTGRANQPVGPASRPPFPALRNTIRMQRQR